LALLLRRQYEFPQCEINKGNIYFMYLLIYKCFYFVNVTYKIMLTFPLTYNTCLLYSSR
jgi:hypothetical protein